MTQQEIKHKALEHINSTYSTNNDRIDRLRSYLAGYNASSIDSQNQIDKLVEGLREANDTLERSIPTLKQALCAGNTPGTRMSLTGTLESVEATIVNARTLLATFTDKKLEDEKEK